MVAFFVYDQGGRLCCARLVGFKNMMSACIIAPRAEEVTLLICHRRARRAGIGEMEVGGGKGKGKHSGHLFSGRLSMHFSDPGRFHLTVLLAVWRW